ncbi:MAG: hypothetical protein ACM359_08605 [Bacillota bacterium]
MGSNHHNAVFYGIFVAIFALFTASMSVHAATIRGFVVIQEEQASKPAPGVTIGLWSSERSAEMIIGGNGTETGPDGQFSFQVDEPGTYYIRMAESRKGKYGDYVWPMAVVPVTVTPKGDDPKPIRLTLREGATISGRALLDSGQPVPWAMVGVVAGGSFGNFDRTNGRFIIRAVAPNQRQRVVVTPTRPESLLYTRYVDVPSEKLRPGRTVDIGDITFAPRPEKPNLRGTYRTSDGQPAEGNTIFRLQHRDEPIEFSIPCKDGQFEFAVFPGVYKAETFRGTNLGSITVERGRVTEMDVMIPPPGTAPANQRANPNDGPR